MTRITTFVQNEMLRSSMMRNQRNVADALAQVTTGKRTTTYQGLGADVGRQVTTRNLQQREQAYSDAAGRAGATLEMYDTHLTHLQSQVMAFKDAIAGALALGEARGLDGAATQAFEALASTLNAKEGGVYLFAGGMTDRAPFAPATLDDLAALATSADAFQNDQLRASARVGENSDVAYGLLADEVGTALADALRSFAAANSPPIDGKLTEAQRTALSAIVGRIDAAANSIGKVQSANGQRQNQVELQGKTADERVTFLQGVIADIEDVDMAEAVTKLQQEQTALQASYQAFSQISRLNLLNFL